MATIESCNLYSKVDGGTQAQTSKARCILGQNALHFARIMPFILGQST